MSFITDEHYVRAIFFLHVDDYNIIMYLLGILCSKTIVTTNKSLGIYIGTTILETNVQIQMAYNEFNLIIITKV